MDYILQNNLVRYGSDFHFAAEMQLETKRAANLLLADEFGMSVVGRNDVRAMFDFYLHRHGDRTLYDDKISDGDMRDKYPDKRVSHVSREEIEGFVEATKRYSGVRGRKAPPISDMFVRVCAYEYFLPHTSQISAKESDFAAYPESPSAYPMVNRVVSEFIREMTFKNLDEYRDKVGGRLDNVIAQSFIDFFARLGDLHQGDEKLRERRGRLKDAAHYDDYAPVFDRYTKNITQDALTRFDLFLEIYKENLQKQVECSTLEDRAVLQEQLDRVQDVADGKLKPDIIIPGTHEARLRAHQEPHTGENMTRRS